MNLEVARKCFIRIRDVRYVELVNRTEVGRRQGVNESLLMAEIMAYQVRPCGWVGEGLQEGGLAQVAAPLCSPLSHFP